MAKPNFIEQRDRYRVFSTVTTRWKDNDIYNHINNAVYNAWMDTAITSMFLDKWLKLPDAPVIPVAVETHLTFHRPIVHPADVETGLRVDRIGNRSVQCGVGIFLASESQACAWGYMIHVFVERATNDSAPIPDKVRRALADYMVETVPP